MWSMYMYICTCIWSYLWLTVWSECSHDLPVASYHREGMNGCRWTAPRFRPHTHAHKPIPAEKTNQCQEMCSNSCLSDWLSLHPNCTFNKWLSLSRSGPRHKRTTQVCVREVITAFHCFSPPPPRSIHTQIQGYWHSGTVKSHKRTKKKTQHGRTQGAWESFWPLPREKGGAQTPWGEKGLFPGSDWKRS